MRGGTTAAAHEDRKKQPFRHDYLPRGKRGGPAPASSENQTEKAAGRRIESRHCPHSLQGNEKSKHTADIHPSPIRRLSGNASTPASKAKDTGETPDDSSNAIPTSTDSPARLPTTSDPANSTSRRSHTTGTLSRSAARSGSSAGRPSSIRSTTTSRPARSCRCSTRR